MIRQVDLFAGLKGWTEPFVDRGHATFTVELYPQFNPDLQMDILDLTPDDLPYKPDIILASPPCTSFTMMSVGKNWTHDGQPKRETAWMGRELVMRTLWLIDQIQPRWFVIENPRARLRTLPFLAHLERREVWYCHYGHPTAKPTDLWGVFPPGFATRPICHNARPEHPVDCCCRDHREARRGSQTGTQGMGSAVSAKIPYELGLDICLATEAAMEVAA